MNAYLTEENKIRPVTADSILIGSESDLATLDAVPGTVAYTAGFGNMWQLDASGGWVAIAEEG